MHKSRKMSLEKKLLLVVGRAANGKTTLVKEVCRRTVIKMVTSYTTRLMMTMNSRIISSLRMSKPTSSLQTRIISSPTQRTENIVISQLLKC